MIFAVNRQRKGVRFMNRYIINITGPDHEAISREISGQAVYNPVLWKFQPLGKAADFHYIQDIFASLAYTCLHVLGQFSPQNHIQLVQTKGLYMPWIGHINEADFQGDKITSLHIPHALVNEDDPDLQETCSVLTERLKTEPFQNDTELIRFLNLSRQERSNA